MPRLLIGNEFNEDSAALADARQKKTAWWTQRLIWFARDHDVLVMAVAPDEEYLRYVTSLTGARPEALTIVVPPPGSMGVAVLSADRLVAPSFLAELRTVLGERPVDEVFFLHPDASVARLARALGVESALPGYGFLAQGGGRLVNSKPAFRAIAGGTGIPLPEGGVCTNVPEADALIGHLLFQGKSVILKHEFRAGGRGNEILSPVEGVLPVGAHRTVVVPEPSALRAYLGTRWDWLSSQGKNPVVVEEYIPDSRAVFAEFALSDDGVEFAAQGEMISAPLAAAEIIPAPDLTERVLDGLLEGGRKLCAPLQAFGYRGLLSADAVVTPDERLLFTEYNARVTGSTHVYGIIGAQLVGKDYARERILLEREGWPVPSFRSAIDALSGKGLLYDPDTRCGVVLIMPYNPTNSSIRYCIVARSVEAGRAQQDVVEALF
ncbi:peptide ligase PGM1-related protein [Streptomyces sp. ALI-76-A]|uniref:preATP grasp domain-containing protein n=1 Tax=Streptomyces sp. ALI-76-A TaxID=3025736 RepID=UPI00256EE2E8|nr:peptide ligase PGM1-related protein [Streptomyces sp. ALI-76-A]MDL5199796.1 peptide ligase PGM1-related protein [Streptomyces sp. ALI-76-A]